MLGTLLLLALMTTTPPVARAIMDAVRERMGADVEVVVNDLAIQAPIAGDEVHATPETGAKLGGVTRFTLTPAGETSGIRTGAATARVTAIVTHAHTTRPIARGTDLVAADLTSATHPVSGMVLRPMPAAAAVVGGKALRSLPSGACISRSDVRALPAVRTGQEVVAVARVAGVEASARMVAASSGDPGSVVRVVNRQSRRALKARVLQPGLVEIIHD